MFSMSLLTEEDDVDLVRPVEGFLGNPVSTLDLTLAKDGFFIMVGMLPIFFSLEGEV